MRAHASKTNENSSHRHGAHDNKKKDQNKNPFTNDIREHYLEKQTDVATDIHYADDQSAFFQGSGTPVVQKSLKASSSNASGNSDTKSNTTNASSNALPDPVRTDMEQAFNTDFSDVNIETNSKKADDLGALAYTQGNTITFGPNQYNPTTQQGRELLGHELTHVVQQREGKVVPTIQQKGAYINDDSALEREADEKGKRAAQTKAQDASSKEGDDKTPQKKPISNSPKPVIQRAMKFEWQMDKGNYMYRDTGNSVEPLPRKYGPQDYIVKGDSGVRLESESGGKPEFETGWEKKWSKIKAHMNEAQAMVKMMNAAKNVKGSDGKTYKELPFSAEQLKHLTPNQGYSTTGSTWDVYQKTGKLLARKDENIRTSPEYNPNDTKFNYKGRIKKGTKLKVVLESDDGKWLKVKSPEISGWIIKTSTKPETKKYESNAKKNEKSIDTELKSNERLLIKIGDASWRGAFQVSESFALAQAKSYITKNEEVKASTYVNSAVDRLMKLPVAQGGSKELRGFLSMVVLFLKRAETSNTKHGYAKAAFKLMSRTNFGSIYKYSDMTKKDKEIFRSLVYGTSQGIIPLLGLSRSSKVFAQQPIGLDKSTVLDVTVYKWLTGIIKGIDYLSNPTANVSGAMGAHHIQKEQGKNKNLVRYENRGPSSRVQPAVNWEKYAWYWFEKATDERPRETGKGKTGLEK